MANVPDDVGDLPTEKSYPARYVCTPAAATLRSSNLLKRNLMVDGIIPTIVANQRSLVLVADDDAGIRFIVALVIQQLGLDTLVVGDGAAAVRATAERVEELCCIILDVRMPVLNGFQAAHAIRKIAPDLEIVMMSATFPVNYEEQIAPLGITQVLYKPFPLEELRAVMYPFVRV
jgi:CheY-like chemotaxis protein